ncbi:hypothetical protein D3C77_630130 [compost metagenome]
MARYKRCWPGIVAGGGAAHENSRFDYFVAKFGLEWRSGCSITAGGLVCVPLVAKAKKVNIR